MAARFNNDDDDLWELVESYVDLISPMHRANPLTDLGFRVSCTISRLQCFVNNLVSTTMKLELSSIDMNIHVYAKLAGHDIT